MEFTQRLYLDDPLRFDFEATVVEHRSHRGQLGIVLDRTAFYPEAGGQMADRGSLGQARVVDVQLDADGSIVHLLEGRLPAVGAQLSGRVDERRRRLYMALHTGQHILSRALLDVAGAHTVSSRLGESACTIDVRPGAVGAVERDRIEQLANDVIDRDLPIRCLWPSPDDLARWPLRKPPKVDQDVRVVAVGDFDLVPCGGTHAVRTGQVGLVGITGVERYKGGQRIRFVAGAWARAELCRHAHELRELSREMSCAPEELPQVVAKLRREVASAAESTVRVERMLASRWADELTDGAERGEPIVGLVAEASPSLLRAIARVAADDRGVVALLASDVGDGLQVVTAAPAGSGFDCGRFVRQVAAACGGRGGGRADHAEGRLPADVAWVELARQAVASG